MAALIGSGGIVLEDRSTAAKWESFQSELGESWSRLTESHHRPALWGEARDERASPYYDLAFEIAHGIDYRSAIKEELDPDELADLREKCQPALDALQRAAHASGVSREVAITPQPQLRRLLDARKLLWLAELEIRDHLENGDELAAVELLLDTLQMGGDLTRSPIMIEEMIGLSLLVDSYLREGIEEGTLLTLSTDARATLLTGLSILDGQLEWSVASLSSEAVWSGLAFEALLPDRIDPLRPWSRASGRKVAMELVTFKRGLAGDFGPKLARDPEAWLAALEGALEEGRALGGETQSAKAISIMVSAARSRLWCVGGFRLALHALEGSEAPKDPWIERFLHSEELEGGRRLWLDPRMHGNEGRDVVVELWVPDHP